MPVKVFSPKTTITISKGKTKKIVKASSNSRIVVSGTGAQGVGLPKGGTARQKLTKVDGTDYNYEWSYDWADLALNIKYNGTSTNIASGRVLEGDFIGIGLIYRFISTAKTGKYPAEDSFYLDFDGTNLTNLIVTRG